MVILLTLGSFFAAFAPILGFVWLVRWMDRYDREPLWAIAVCFLWGAMGATSLAGTANFLVSTMLGLDFDGFVLPVIVAPITEEPAKALILIAMMTTRPFDNATDGFVYGAVTGLGFAAGENLQYFQTAALQSDAAAWFNLTVIRTGWSAMIHTTASSIVGAAVGSLRFRPDRTIARVRNAFFIAMAIHSAWNFVCFSGSPLLIDLGFAGVPILVVCLLLALQVCLWDEHKLLKTELSAESKVGTLPQGHVQPLSSWWARRRGAWLAKDIDREAYVKAATRLAFRRRQLEFDKENAFLKEEVKRWRIELRGLLRGHADATRS